jgi:phosphoribosylglycinamide formyltransferase 1
VTRAVVLISGRGSNMAALLRAALPVEFAAVISNTPEALGLETARGFGVATAVVDHRAFADRAAFDAALAEEIDRHAPDLVILAGFMRVLSADFVRHYTGRMINIHPALLPAFPGLHTHRRALQAGVKLHGCTVHFVTPEVDVGPIIVQAAVPVFEDDSEATLAARVLEQEHRVFPMAIRWFAEGRLRFGSDAKVSVDAAVKASGTLVSPPAAAG